MSILLEEVVSCFYYSSLDSTVQHLRHARQAQRLSSESVQSAALSLEGVHDVKRGDGLAASVLSVGHGISDDVLKEDLEDTSGLLVDQAGDALDTASARQSADGGLGDALDVVSEDLSVALGAALAESLATLAAP